MAKIIMPITNMILARLLTPDEFGVIATITMITSFADMLADAGFQKYIIQHEFKSENEKNDSINVAFWTNIVISIFIWIVIVIFSSQIAKLLGTPNLHGVISVACIQIPITAFSSIQIAACKREFNYKGLFFIRIVSISIPFIVTIPLALLGFSYWSLIVGSLISGIFTAIILTLKFKWKPKLKYNVNLLKEMFSFSFWSLIEAVSIWLTTWVDIFVIGSVLDSYYLGVYKTSINTVNSIMSIVAVATTTIIFSALSRLQNDEKKFQEMFFLVQKLMAIVLFPMGVGIFVYSDLVTNILLGSQWKMASEIIGIWALTSAIKMVLGDYCSEAFRAKGKPKISLIAQVLHLIVLIPVCAISVNYGFRYLVYSRAWIRIQLIIIQWILMVIIIKIPILKSIRNILPYAITSILMGGLGVFLKGLSNNYIWQFISIGFCVIFYILMTIISDSFAREKIIELKNRKIFNNKEVINEKY
ncbi:lipopolysaccharide biosynthesis protein [Clostridium sardiniense]|uniref:Lipopolysaccharide biosynthesis protein n=2 Tax=Clostridium sardiniense TaxID=29369 RepID=A0ABS7KT05_CLOSR|nr:lipopolysaccharide biosynthesis protein [Clostridium sardiniense]